MAHAQQIEFCKSVKEKYPSFFKGKMVLDIGSLDINGNNRYLFEDCLYLGIDVGEGQNIDIVCKAHELSLPDNSFDAIISTETLEHDRFYSQTLRNAYRLLKPGGLLLLTCATEGRPEHGTGKTTPADSPLLAAHGDWSNYYKNLSASDIREVLDLDALFHSYTFASNTITHDLYFYGFKIGTFVAREDYSFLYTAEEQASRERLRTIEINTLKKSLASKDKALLSLEASHSRLATEMDDLRRSETLLREQLAKVERTNVEAQGQIELLNQAIAANNERIRRFEKSRSWRLTRPLRAFMHLLRGVKTRLTPKKLNLEISPKREITILATRHVLFVAHLFDYYLTQEGFSVSIHFNDEPLNDRGQLYIVICPQMFKELPRRFVAFQMEQLTNSRWITEDYLAKLKRSLAIFDYSTKNISYLQRYGLRWQDIFLLPISPIPNYPEYLRRSCFKRLRRPKKSIDVLFYGDPNCPRRQRFINKLQSRFKLSIASEVFGEKLAQAILSARVIVNIHYYENALLETTRIFESLSFGVPVVSESSIDQKDHSALERSIVFTPVDDVDAMIAAIGHLLTDQAAYDNICSEIDSFVQNDTCFSDYLHRFLLAQDYICFDEFNKPTSLLSAIDTSPQRLCLSLSETTQRREAFLSKPHYNFVPIEGLRHRIGWVGCGMSYKYLAKQLLRNGIQRVAICEDDVLFPDNFEEKFEQILSYLDRTQKHWHIFCGMITHLHPQAAILDIDEHDGIIFVFLDKMTSMVCNIYSMEALILLSRWDQTNPDTEHNTIDRYLENSAELITVTTYPFLVDHGEEHTSSIWGFNNSKYESMIHESERLLKEKIDEFKTRNQR